MRSIPALSAAVFVVLVGLGAAPQGCSEVRPGPAPRLGLLGLEGEAVDPFDGVEAGEVFVFLRTDCPISNRYAPEIKRLASRYAARGIRFWLVYPDASDAPERVQAHLDQYAYDLPALFDPGRTLVRAARAEVTPEAALFDPARQRLYHGRIDDRFVSFSETRPAPTRRDLQAAMDALLAGAPVPAETAPAVGCAIEDPA